jgi:uncharacterized protein YyaL (SSP411 family)
MDRPSDRPSDPPSDRLSDPPTDRPANRLAGETSPYLLQHAHNPVDWYPWGPEALARAKSEDKPIFLSIGYAACHWCHVMERESFEDEATAAELNRDFVAIKVDREERPDLDQVYMAAVQALTGQGGWPMSVFLTPDGTPFYGGTYFPDRSRHGLPAFRQVLARVAEAFRSQRSDVEASGAKIVRAIEDAGRFGAPAAAGATAGAGTTAPADATTATTAPITAVAVPPLPEPSVLDAAVAALERGFDARTGGWGSAPKFPQPMSIEFLLRRAACTGDPRALAMARRSLDAMAVGGIHDQLGGGFHRYATDAVWLVPHFEQMLYDNAQLARVYLHAWSLTGDPTYLEVATGTLDYLVRELRTIDGGFAASQDADTQGEEGSTFTWSAGEVRARLGPDAALFEQAYDVTEAGNWEGRTILRRVRTDAELATAFATTPADVAAQLASARAALLRVRAERPQPARDDKVLAGWNGLALGALADAARALAGDPVPGRAVLAETYRVVATDAADALLAGLFGPDGRLRRSWKDGRATADGVLEDHACLAEGLLALYEATFDERWFVAARRLADRILAGFADPAGGFFDTDDRHERLVVRPKDLQDNAVPSGNAMAVTVLLRLGALTGEGRYRDAAERALGLVAGVVARYPGAFAQWLVALDFALADVFEVAVVGDPADPETRRLLGPTRRGFRPHLVVTCSPDPRVSAIELMQARFQLGGLPTAFVCRGFACRQPVHEPEALAAQLLMA